VGRLSAKPKQQATPPFSCVPLGTTKKDKRMQQAVTGWIILVTGGIFIGFGTLHLLKVQRLIQGGIKAKGKIIGTVEEVGSEGPAYRPIIEYSIHTGEVLRIKSKIGWASLPEDLMV
jgi:hypothetical protein